jgi:hypothetical protein
MDVLAAMFRAAESAGILHSLATAGAKHRVSLYADDVVVFARPEARELYAVRAILECFGHASGLHVNFAKSAAAPIRCSPEVLQTVAPALSCQVVAFPCAYLDLPLSLTRLHKRDLQLVLEVFRSCGICKQVYDCFFATKEWASSLVEGRLFKKSVSAIYD